MPSNYRTPGVYVEEISKFPPSVAAVQTAIPAFVCYTEKATDKVADDLIGVPTRITAIAEYTNYFGSPAVETEFSAEIIDTIDPISGRLIRRATVPELTESQRSPYLMAYAIQSYFANGGGPCYIISIGKYADDNVVDATSLGNNLTATGGLDLLEKEDEPTLIIFPDAQALNDGDFYGLYQAALAQCNKLGDRFLVMDTKGFAPTTPAQFRNGIGSNFLKYGAVYYPFIETNLNYRYRESDVTLQHTTNPIFGLAGAAIAAIDTATTTLSTADNNINGLNASDLANAVTTAANRADAITAYAPLNVALTTVLTELGDAQTALETIISTATNVFVNLGDPDVETALANIVATGTFSSISDQITAAVATIGLLDAAMARPEIDAPAEAIIVELGNITNLVNTLTNISIPSLSAAITGNDPNQLIQNVTTQTEGITTAINLVDDIDQANAAALVGNIASTSAQITTILASITNINRITEDINEIAALNISFPDLSAFNSRLEGINTALADSPDQGEYIILYSDLQRLFGEVSTAVTNTRNSVLYLDLSEVTVGTLTLDQIENIDNASYNAIKLELDSIGVKLPPSSTMAGIYAQVDRDRGVWKAPANVSLSGVTRPLVKITNDSQDLLNIDPTAGKSINAIRAFTGKGTMVWGARTLAGNDNEWRYISVRRFFNFVEESVKKATEQFVFEPNDANTWVKVRAMIENFLIIQWRDGALQGAKPDQAFYVRVGLGETMTAVDILEGKMIVEIGMAVVRPAEFIILRFSHKLAES